MAPEQRQPDDLAPAADLASADEDPAETGPTIEELDLELTDLELCQKGMEFAAKHLLYRVIASKGYECIEKPDWRDVRKAQERLEKLFPMVAGGHMPSHLENFYDAFRTSFQWANDRFYREWKIRKVAEKRGGNRYQAEADIDFDDMVRKMTDSLGIKFD